MLRQRAFWWLFVAVNIVAWWFTFAYFTRAYPLLETGLTMGRGEALEAATKLAQRHGWGPESFQQAAIFETDEVAQAFLDLAGGGTESLLDPQAASFYLPYTWRVRHFSQGEPREAEIRFTPAGGLYGFRLTLPEDAPGPALDDEAARELAERAARTEPGIRFESFVLLDSSREIRSSGRIDHTWTYELSTETLAIAPLRLRVVLSGDQLTEVTPYLEVPEGFERRYAQLRSGNQTLASIARFAMLVVLLGGGCLGGLIFLLRRQDFHWKPALACGLGLGLVEFLGGLNRSSLWWIEYDTAVSERVFLAQQTFQAFASAFWLALGTSLLFLVAEGLTRHALPDQIQLWKTGKAAASSQILGRTAAAYLLVGPYCAYKVAFLLFTSGTLGWWLPASQLAEPNILATWLPWLGPWAAALRAGLSEEALFRMVPMAAAVLLGRRFGQRWLWIGTALVLQALIFGAAHAHYPNLPAYARLVELFVPALLYGLLFLRFGILPGILLHFVFDVLAFGLPVLASTASGSAVNVALLVVLAVLPLAWVAVARWRGKAAVPLDEGLLNRAWEPPPVSETQDEERPAAGVLGLAASRWLRGAGLVGGALWLLLATPPAGAPSLGVDREAAVSVARQEAERRGWQLDGFSVVTRILGDLDPRHFFIWQEGGRELFDQQLGEALRPPRWQVRFARFQGDLSQRVEEIHFSVAEPGEVYLYSHRVPDESAGAHLEEPAVLGLVAGVVSGELGLSPQQLRPVAIIPRQRPARRDWQVTFRDPVALPPGVGELHVTVHIAGDQVVGVSPQIIVPEEWQRKEQNRATLAGVLHDLSILVFVTLVGVGVLAAVIRWSARHFAGRVAAWSFGLMAVLWLIQWVNQWPLLQAGLSTMRSPFFQALGQLSGVLPAALGILVVLALLVGFFLRWPPLHTAAKPRATMLSGVALGGAVLGLVSLAFRWLPAYGPNWPEYSLGGAFFPWLAISLHALSVFLIAAVLTLLVFTGLEHLTAGWVRHRLLAAILVLGTGLGLRGWTSPTLAMWWSEGLLLGGLCVVSYALVLRRSLSLAVPAVAVVVSAWTLLEGWGSPFPGALPGAVIAAVVVLASGYAWVRATASPIAGTAQS